MKTCERCGASLPDDEEVCSYCGKEFNALNKASEPKTEDNNNFCKNCGGKLLPVDAFCTRCGTKVDSLPSQNTQSFDQTTAYHEPEHVETNTIGVCSIIFALLFPIVGLILGIVGLSKYKIQKNRTLCIIGIVISIISFIINLIYSKEILDRLNDDNTAAFILNLL